MTTTPTGPFADKARWHADQRRRTPREKIRVLIELQRREAESDRIRASLGRPARAIVPWNVQA